MLEWKENSHGERYLPSSNTSFEQNASRIVFQQYLHDYLKEPNVLYVILGSDSGLLPIYVREQFADNGSHFIFIEEEAVFNWLQTEYPVLLPEPANIDTNNPMWSLPQAEATDTTNALIYVVKDPFEWETIAQCKRFDSFILRQKIFFVKSLSVADRPERPLSQSVSFYESQFGRFRIDHNIGQHRFFMQAGLQTVMDMIYPLKRIKGCYTGKTFVLLGGAPSLPLIFPWLRAHRESVVVIAANRIAGRLAMEAITPDFFVAVDPQPEVLDYSQKIFDFQDDSILISSNHLAPNVMSQWAGASFYMHTRFMFTHVPEQERGNISSSGPTVMNSSLMVAAYLGAETIILSGVDMCFDPSGNSHESSSIESSVGRYLRRSDARVMTYAGIEAETDIQMFAAGEALKEQVKWIQQIAPDTRVINVNPYATQIDVIEQCSPEALPAISHPVTAQEKAYVWQQAKLTYPTYRQLLQQDVLKPLTTQIRHLTQAHKWAKSGLTAIHKLRGESISDYNTQIDKIIQRREQIEQAMGEDLFVLFNYSFVDYVKLLEPLESTQPTIDESLDTLESYFATIVRTTRDFKQVLEKLVDKARWRQMECQPKLTQELLDFWLQESTPGRCHVWWHRHGCPKLSEQEQQRFDKAAHEFHLLVTEKAPSFRKSMQSKEQKLISLWSYVKVAIKAKDRERLQDLATYAESVDEDDFVQVARFIRAHVATLARQWQESSDLLAQVDHERLRVPVLNLRLENALQQRDVVSVLEILEDLAQYDVYHYFVLATFANALGLDELAGQAYERYLQIKPSDLVVLWAYWRWLEPKQDSAAIQDLIDFMAHYQVHEPDLAARLYAAIAQQPISEPSSN